nr:hypothetical protein [Tanacetum cinerariifolium]
MRWFSRKEFPRDSPVDVIDRDMFLETLLNDNPTQIRRYPKEFLVLLGLSRMWYVLTARPVFYDDDDQEMNLQNFINVPNPFDVVCAEKKITKNGKPLLEQTANVITQPYDTAINLDVVPLSQLPLISACPFPTNTRKRSQPRTSVLESASKKGKNVGSFGYGVHMAGESITQRGWSFASTRSEPLVSSRPRPKSKPMAHHILGIIFDSIQDSIETPRKDRLYASVSVDPSVAKGIYCSNWELTNDFIMDKRPLPNVATTRHITLFFEIRLRLENAEIERSKLERRLGHNNATLEEMDAKVECLRNIVNDKPSGEAARLRFGLEEAEKEVLRLKMQVEGLKAEANKVSGLLASYAQKETDLSALNAKFQDLLREKEQLELCNASLSRQVDEET